MSTNKWDINLHLKLFQYLVSTDSLPLKKTTHYNKTEWQQKHGQHGQIMFLANWLIVKKVKSDGLYVVT